MTPEIKKYSIGALVIFVLLFLWAFTSPLSWFFQPNDMSTSVGVTSSPATSSVANVSTFADNLRVPWGLAFMPDGHILVTERDGRLLRFNTLGERIAEAEVEEIRARGEGGLLGVGLHPDFASNRLLYLYETYDSNEGTANRVVRYRLDTDFALADRSVIIEGIPGASYHDGGRLAFGPDGYLYITTGDAGEEDLAQDLDSFAGKILRLNADGSTPADNPFNSPVYSYGHRNPQGLSWDRAGNLFSSEHGPSGFESGWDELNLIEAGANYGWPVTRGMVELGPEADAPVENYQNPMIGSGSETTWAPASAQFYEYDDDSASVFFGGLRGQSLYEARLSPDHQSVESLVAHFQGQYGRIRTVTLGPDGFLYLTTSNRDGRGNPVSGDDRIIRVNPRLFLAER